MRRFVRKYGVGMVLAGLGLILVLVGTGVGLGYTRMADDAPAPAEASTLDTPHGGLVATARVHLEAFGLVADREVRVDPALAQSLPLPGARVHRDLDTPIAPAPVRLDVELDLATGSHARRSVADGASAQSEDVVLVAPPAPAGATLAAAALTTAGLVAYFWTSLKTWGTKLLVLPVMGLYAKITRAEVFENDVRERIFAAIKANPGIAASDLSRIAGVAWGTTIYHLDVLEQTRMVSSIREGRFRRYFENGATLAADKKTVAILQNAVTASVVSIVRATPGATQKELALATGMSPQALHWHLTRLVKAGVVRKEREGRVVRHFASA